MGGLYSILTVCILITLIKFSNKDINNTILWGCMSCLTIIILIQNYNEPKAIDVYKGKTKLEIIYKNNVPIDSIVVFKK